MLEIVYFEFIYSVATPKDLWGNSDPFFRLILEGQNSTFLFFQKPFVASFPQASRKLPTSLADSGRFGPIWADSGRFGLVWSSLLELARVGLVWLDLARFGSRWLDLA